MKFTKLEHKTTAEKEYKIYAYLNAINNPDVEAFGIPTIFYYGTWHDHVLMAMTLLESPLKRKIKQITEVDLLIVFQQIVSRIYSIEASQFTTLISHLVFIFFPGMFHRCEQRNTFIATVYVTMTLN